MSYGKRAGWDAIREQAFGDMEQSFQAVGGVTTKAVRVVKVTNATPSTIYFTTDSTEDQLKLPPNSYQLWDTTTNKALGDAPQFIEIGTQFYTRYEDDLDPPASGYASVELLIVESGS